MGSQINKNQIIEIFDLFSHQYEYQSHKSLTSGHINDTFLIETDGNEHYVLQRINSFVFKDVPGLVNNKVLISNHLSKKANQNQQVVKFVKARQSANYYIQDKDAAYWNLMIFIPNSITHEVVTDKQIAYEAGVLLGNFLNDTADFDASQLIEVIPRFHDMSFRFQQYEDALQNASVERLEYSKKYRKTISELKEEMHILENLKGAGKIPVRVTHNDTKISNSLFDKYNKGICLIDLDTVMPGIVHYDFGDAIRTICNSAAEDEADLQKVSFNKDFYEAYLEGFLSKTKNSLTELEIRLLPLGAKTMIFIMALRFLTDYLNNDVYYKTNYATHNLVRAKNQFKLLESFTTKINYDTT